MTLLRSSNIIFILSAPSGGGKSSLAHELVKEQQGKITYPISVTTRLPRIGEVDNQDYNFVTPIAFEQLVTGGQLIEHATVFGNKYGVTASAIHQAMQQGTDVILTIDWQGMLKVKELFRHTVVTVYLLPPSLDVLRDRLAKRSDNIQDIEFRMQKALNEISHYCYYDYVLINDNFQHTLDKLINILKAARNKIQVLDLLPKFVSSLT